MILISTLNLFKVDVSKSFTSLMAILLCIGFTQSCVAEELDLTECAYFPQFKQLYKKLSKMKPVSAVLAIWDYEKNYNNPAACESDLILSLIEKYEKQLFYIKSEALKITSESLYRCFEFDPVYTICNGIIADDTAHYEMAGIATLPLPTKHDVEIISDLPGATLLAVYQTTVKRIFDKKSAIKLNNDSDSIILPKDFEGHILIAMYKTPQKSWPYRKVIWFF